VNWLPLATFLVLLGAGVPIPFVIGGTAVVWLLAGGGVPLTIVPQRMFSATDALSLVAIPCFILAGAIMNSGSMSERLIGLAQAIVGRFRGGLAYVNVLSNVYFAGVTGSAAAEASAIGSIMIPAMERAGYSRPFAAALTAAASLIGPIIPPSIPLLIYGVLSGVSIAALFLAGLLPGLLLAAAYGVLVWVMLRGGGRGAEGSPGRGVARALWEALPALAMPLIIVGGMLGGVFTATEASVVAVLYALLIDGVVYRELSLRGVWKALRETVAATGVVMFVLAMTEALGWLFASHQIPQRLAANVLSWSKDRVIVLLLVNLLLLLVGIPIETAPALVLTVPVLLPLVSALGVDPVHFGVVVVLNLVLGLITPPVGASLFVVSAISGLPLEKLSRAILPFIYAGLVVLGLVTYIPWLSLALPRLLVR
jgi:C4-dicarboxylate transporter DctM subunit